MANFAELNQENIVLRVIVVGDDVPTSNGPLGENPMHIDGETYCTNLFGGNWKQSSINGEFRKNPATWINNKCWNDTEYSKPKTITYTPNIIHE